MARTNLSVLPCLLLLAASVLSGQAPAKPSSGADRTTHITLGQSAVPLYGPWMFTVGDSPIDPKTGQPLWAEPGFDDSKWETVDLTPKGDFDPIGGLSGYVPGWTAKGHPGYWGYAWYRIRVEIQARPGTALALAGPADVDDAYQVFENGQLAGQFGDFTTGNKPAIYPSGPQMFSLPGLKNSETGRDTHGPERPGSTESTLAFRVWMDPSSLVATPDAGGMHSAPVLGDAGAVSASYQTRWLEVVRAYASSAAEALLFSLLAVVAFSLILFDRSDRVYLWMGALFLLLAAGAAVAVVGEWTRLLSWAALDPMRDTINAWVWAAWIMVWRVWFGLERPRSLPWLSAGLALLLMISSMTSDEVFFPLVPHHIAIHFVNVSLALQLLFFVLLLWIVIQGIRRHGAEGWLVLPVAVLRGIGAFTFELRFLHIRAYWFPLGARFGLDTIANLLVAVVIALLLLRRLLQSVKRQRLMALDVKQAQEVQQVILPEARLVLPGLSIESEYRPAREVGGDFFQIIPHKSDSSVLIVAGDVTGKGLQAGMLVALLVGAIRTAARFSLGPVEILAELNQRLLGRNDARATCLALRIAANGEVVLANAGHLPPYLNGTPLEIEGSLPLGLLEDCDFTVLRFRMEAGDRLLLVSDGVAEATDGQGKLFGFDRALELARAGRSAAQIAETVQAFGQEDDISVIAVTRMPVAEPAMA